MIGEWVKVRGQYGQVTRLVDGFAYIRTERGETYRITEAKLRDAMQTQEWQAQDLVIDPADGQEKPMGTPFNVRRKA